MTGMKHLWLLGEKYIVVYKGDGKNLREDPDKPGYYTIKASLYPGHHRWWLDRSRPLR